MQHHSRGVAGEHVLRLHNKQDTMVFWVRRGGEFHGHKCLLIVFIGGDGERRGIFHGHKCVLCCSFNKCGFCANLD